MAVTRKLEERSTYAANFGYGDPPGFLLVVSEHVDVVLQPAILQIDRFQLDFENANFLGSGFLRFGCNRSCISRGDD